MKTFWQRATDWLKRQRAWVAPLALAIAIYVLLIAITEISPHPHGTKRAVGVIDLIGVIASLALLTIAVQNGSIPLPERLSRLRERIPRGSWPTHTATNRADGQSSRQGSSTTSQTYRAAQGGPSRPLRTTARELFAQLAVDSIPEITASSHIPLEPGETLLFEGPAYHSRFLTERVTYVRNTGSLWGNQTSSLWDRDTASLWDRQTSKLGYESLNRQRRETAERVAAPRWRAHRRVRLAATNHRILCRPLLGQWESYPYTHLTGIQPQLWRRRVILEFSGDSPSAITGTAAASVAVIVIWAVHGSDGLAQHPALSSLQH